MRRFVLGLDEGTTSARGVLYDVDKQEIVDIENSAIKQYYPQSGWVEQDADEIYKKVLKVSKSLFKKNNVEKGELLGIGITNQRETVVAWNRETGQPICKAIVWQCRRTSSMIDKLSQKNKNIIKEKTGLIANPYFSASKMKWILDNVKEAKTLAKQNKLCFGTIDSFLTFKLTNNFVTDTTNASRTMLMNIHTLEWDDELLKIFNIPKSSLPKICSSDENFGNTKSLQNAPVCALIGDQMSSMIGQGAIENGSSKVTFGTGAFILTNIGTSAKKNLSNLLTTVAFTLSNKTMYAIEGSVYSACSAINWLENNLKCFSDVKTTADMAKSLKDNGGVYFVPAFTGLGAPYWNNEARAAIVGMNFDTDQRHIVRACLESMAYNTKAIVDEMKNHGQKLKIFSVDGGASNNDFVLQFLSDMLNQKVVKSKNSESTVLGAIYVAMLSLKLIDFSDIKKLSESNKCFSPNLNEKDRRKFYNGWQEAIRKI